MTETTTQVAQTTDLQRITTGLQAFEAYKATFTRLAEEAKAVSLASHSIEEVSTTRKGLKAARVQVEKEGKGMRDLITPISKGISAKEKEIVSITSGEEERLQKIEDDHAAEVARIKKEKEEAEHRRIQARIEGLAKYNVVIDLIDAATMDDADFGVMLEKAKADFEAEEARLKAEQEAIAAAKLAEEERQKQIAEDNRKEAERLAAIAKQQEEAAAEIKRQQDEITAKQVEREAELRRQQQAIEDEKARIEKDKQDALEAEARKVREAAEAEQRKAELKKAQDEAAAKALKDKADQEEADRIKAEKKAARQPDKAKILAYAESIASLECLPVKSEEAAEVLAQANRMKAALTNFLTESANAF